MSGQSEEDAWRSIVENYGERAEVEPEPPAGSAPAGPTSGASYADLDAERFVPPPPPPLPYVPPALLAAWLGLFGAPVVLLVALVLRIDLPGWFAYGLVGAFVGGFLYLVARMQRGPRDPGDDGARL